MRYPNVMEEVLIASSFLSAQSPFVLPVGEEMDARQAHHSFRDMQGDFVAYVKMFRTYSEMKNKEAFCKKNYLDERVMAEIQNIKIQLEEIVSQKLQLPVLSNGNTQGWLNRGYEGAAVGAALGAGITGYNSNSAGATLGVGLAAGLVGMAADAMVEDVNYTMITDVQIAERTKATVTTDNVAALRQGTSGAKIPTSTETGNQHKYQTRVVSNANKVNLKFEEAKPVLEDQLAKSIANIL